MPKKPTSRRKATRATAEGTVILRMHKPTYQLFKKFCAEQNPPWTIATGLVVACKDLIHRWGTGIEEASPTMEDANQLVRIAKYDLGLSAKDAAHVAITLLGAATGEEIKTLLNRARKTDAEQRQARRSRIDAVTPFRGWFESYMKDEKYA